jgi:UDPglucose 6-dehydrogenase
VLQVNHGQKLKLIEKVKNHFNDLSGVKLALWGLAFKPDTDDIREAPALYMIDALLAAGAEITAYDPEAMDNVRELYGDKIAYTSNAYAALENKDALLIATEWGAFRNPDFDKIKSSLASPKIFDGRNLFDIEEMEGKGFYYESIGRRTVLS